jgi:hypothetical protein
MKEEEKKLYHKSYLSEKYLYEELTPESVKNIKQLEIILVQTKKFKDAIEGVSNPALIKKSLIVFKRLTEESFKVKARIRTTINHYKNKKSQIRNNAISIKSINADIKKLESSYYGVWEINKILSDVKKQLRNSIENIKKEKEQVKKREYIKNKTLDYVTTQGIFKIIGKFLKTKLAKKNMIYINFYNQYVLLGMDFNTISKQNKLTNGYVRQIKLRLEQFINRFIQNGELQKYIKEHSGLKINFKNQKITLSTNFGTGSHSEHLFKKDVRLK